MAQQVGNLRYGARWRLGEPPLRFPCAMALHSIDPATGDLLALHQEHSPEQVTQVLASAAATQRDWRHTSFT
jgi:acyl-CoA reductase-like NAD-dependent aldehyde dehydrogenase